MSSSNRHRRLETCISSEGASPPDSLQGASPNHGNVLEMLPYMLLNGAKHPCFNGVPRGNVVVELQVTAGDVIET